MWDPAARGLAVDPAIRALSPPLDAIRPGNTFSLQRLPWFAATAYPVVLALPAPPVGPAPAHPASPSDLTALLAPLAASGMGGGGGGALTGGAAGSATGGGGRRVGVVLGQTYLVLADYGTGAPPGVHADGSARPVSSAGPVGGDGASAPAPALAQRGRAVSVVPLHYTYVSVPSGGARHVADVRFVTRTRVALARPIATSITEADAGGGGGVLEVAGFTLVMDTAELAAITAAHVDAARRRILAGKLGVARAL
jgi:hypothetical protein